MKSNDFQTSFRKKAKASLQNDWKDNFDVFRFGSEKLKKEIPGGLRGFIRKLKYKYYLPYKIERYIRANNTSFQHAYDLLEDDYSKSVYLELLIFRLLGHRHVKLSRNTPEYWKKLTEIENCIYGDETIDTHFQDWKLRLFDLTKLGYNIRIFNKPTGILHEFVLQQYRYNQGSTDIVVNAGDIVIDAGGCWGDTALYFASKTGSEGKVFTLEFVPNNLSILRRNISLNPELKPIIEIIENPLWSQSGAEIFFTDRGPGSKIAIENIPEAKASVNTLSIDDLVSRRSLNCLDFIKMDIEGAELPSLKGAVNTIRKFRPGLAISIYHSMHDFTDIIKWIDDLRLGYKFYVDHFTIHWEETVLFATAKSQV
jgi:FkbM family methyltransferase